MELLPCPFCGSSDIAFQEGSTFRWIEAMCQNCGATCGETRATTLGEPDEEMDKRLAATEWNRRASPASAPEGWKHSCNALCLDGVELWIPQCPHCGKPAPTPPVSEGRKDAESTLEFICALEVRLIELAGELPSQNLMHKLSSLRQRVTDRKWELLRKAPVMQEDKP